MKKNSSRGIVFRLNLIVLSLISLGLIVFSTVMGVTNYQKVTANLATKSANTAKLAAIALRDPIWNISEEGLKTIVSAIMTDVDIVAVKILEADGETELLHQFKGDVEDFEQLKAKEENLYSEASVLNEGDEIGSIHLLISTNRADSVIQSTTQVILFFAVVLILVIGGSVSLTANKVIKVPIDALKEGAKQLTEGNLEQKIETNRQDELGSLAKSFAAMRDAIREKIQLIEEYNRNLEKKVEERTEALQQKTNDIQVMMQNIVQGVFTLMEGNVIHPEYSEFLETIIPDYEIAGANVMKCLFSSSNLGPDTLDQLEVGLGAIIGEDAMMYDFNKGVLIRECQKKMPDGKWLILEFEWIPMIDDNDQIEKMMVTVRDVTEVRKLFAEAEEQRAELEIIGEILTVSQDKFEDFSTSSTDFIDESMTLLESEEKKSEKVIEALFRNLHTVKGNARTLGFVRLTQIVHETEQDYMDLRKDLSLEWNPRKLKDQLKCSEKLLNEYIRINTNKLGRKGPGRRGAVEKYMMIPQEQIDLKLKKIEDIENNPDASCLPLLQEFKEAFTMLGTSSFEDVLGSILQSLPELASDLGKETPLVEINPNRIFCKNQIVGLIQNTLMHLFRNSLDHGIESSEERSAQGKSREGHIALDLSQSNDHVLMRLKDDGAGLNLSKLRDKALAEGVIDDSSELSPIELANLIFMSGLSTAEQVTEVSGRGVGMDAVKNFLQREKGDIEIQLLEDQAFQNGNVPFEILISLPEKNFIQV